MRTSKTKLASTVADMASERDIAEQEASAQRDFANKLKEQVAVLTQDKELEQRSNSQLKEQLEVKDAGWKA